MAVVAVLVVGVIVGTIPPLVSEHPNEGLTILLLIVTPLPIVVRVLQHKFDPFEPIAIISLVLFLLFAVRPAAELHYDIIRYFNMDIRPGFAGAAMICLVATTCLYIGYASGAGAKAARSIRPLPEAWDARRSVRFAIRLLIVCAMLTGIFALTVGPGTLLKFYLGRTNTDYKTFLTVSGYVGLGPYLTIPASFILLYAWGQLRTIGVGILAVATLAIAFYVTVPRGDRTYILAITLPLLVAYYLRRGTRPSGLASLAAVFVAVLGMNLFLAIRHVDRRANNGVVNSITETLTHPSAEIEEFIKGVDMSEFSVIELEYQATSREQNELEFHPGATVVSALGYWIPRKIYKNKPKAAGEYVAQYLFPIRPSAVGPAKRASFNAAMFGDLWADYGYVSIILGCALVGFAARTFWEYFLLYSRSEGLQIVYAATLPLLIIMLRNNMIDAIARSLFQVAPLVLCLIVCSRARTHRRARKPAAGQPAAQVPAGVAS